MNLLSQLYANYILTQFVFVQRKDVQGQNPPNHHHQNNLKGGNELKQNKTPAFRKECGEGSSSRGGLRLPHDCIRSGRGSKISFCSGWHLRLYQPSARGPLPLQAAALVAETLRALSSHLFWISQAPGHHGLSLFRLTIQH